MNEMAAQTLDVIAREVAATLGVAREALEAHAEQPPQPGALERCTVLLHEVQGVLRVVEVYGAALLAEEMEQVTRFLVDTPSGTRQHSEGLEALMRSMVQLPAYVERVLAGGRDLALVLLPLLNDLRAVRGSALLSEGTLLVLNLSSDRQPVARRPAPGEPVVDVQQWARRLRTRFQGALLGWIRGEQPVQNLRVLGEVAGTLEQVATAQPVFQFWWVVGAVIEALLEGGIEPSATPKRLLGQADRELKRLYEIGEDRYAVEPPLDLLNNLLYYVANTSTAGERVTAVRASFKLQELLPVSSAVEHEREQLAAPSTALMRTVGAAIREDLSRVKDVLDIFVRKGSETVADLVPQVELLRKISDTLGVLDLGGLRARIRAEVGRLEDIVAGRLPPTDRVLVEVAATLIDVEDSLDDALLSLALPGAQGQEVAVEHDGHDAEFRRVQEAVLRECIVNLTRIKEAVATAVAHQPVLNPEGVPELARGITAALWMLGRERARDVMAALAHEVQGVLRAPESLSPARLDRLADAMVSIEYYMETLEAGRGDPGYMLDNAEACLQALNAPPVVRLPASVTLSAPRVAVATRPGNEVLFDQTVHIPPPAADPHVDTVPDMALALTTERTTEPAHEPAHESAAATLMASVGAQTTIAEAQTKPPPVDELATQAVPAAAHLADPSIDPELVELFTDEAREELAVIERVFPLWVENPGQLEALVRVRRAFHTLKGSGRMVGARAIGEFAWVIETLLNRVLNNTLPRSTDVVRTVRDAVAELPGLITHLATGGAAPTSAGWVAARAQALGEGRDPATVTEPLPLALGAPRAAAAMTLPLPSLAPPPVDEMDPQLAEIYRAETAAHLVSVRAFLAGCVGHIAPYVVTEALHRACHTLSGASKMAAAHQGIRVAEPLNLYLRKLFDHGVGLPELGRMVLAAAMDAMEEVAEHVDEPLAYFAHHEELLLQLDSLHRALDHEIATRGLRPQGAGEEVGGDESLSGLTFTSLTLEPAPVVAPEEPHEAMPEPPPAPEPVPQLELQPAPQPAPQLELQPEPQPAPEPAPQLELQPEPQPAPEPEPVEVVDTEIAAIFGEEATELLEAADAALAEWREDLQHTAALSELKRLLHTLKGGARMAGLNGMGSLAHEVETLLNSIENSALSDVSSVMNLLQRALDQLAALRDCVVAGATAAVDTTLMSLLKDAIRAPALERLLETAPATAVPEITPEITHEIASETAPETAPSTAVRETAEPATAELEIAPEPAPQFALEVALQTAPEQGSVAVPPGREPVGTAEPREMARVDAELLDDLLNNAGEVSILRARLEQQWSSVEANLAELSRVTARLKEQLRRMEMETEAQILTRHQHDADRGGFDPLELDRYSSLQQYSRALAESASDVASLQGLLEHLTRDGQNLLMQQARGISEMQNGLMRSRMVAFQRHVPRLSRLVRQAAQETGKQAELVVTGASGELDRQVLERLIGPFEHLLRNAVVHGLELPAERVAAGKPAEGRIEVALHRENSEMIITVADDGAGFDLRAIRERARAQGLVAAGAVLTDSQAIQLVLEPGFSTASSVTQSAGRGVGMDVVATAVKKLGGSLNMEGVPGRGARFTLRLPFTLAVSQALIVRTADELYALPLPTVEAVVRLPKSEVLRHLAAPTTLYEYGNQRYRFQHLGLFLGAPPAQLPEQDVAVPVVLVRCGEHSTALVVDELVGNREVVVKSVGPQVGSIQGIAGATILGDGRIVLILDMPTLAGIGWRARSFEVVPERVDNRPFALVVDDSITVRRVTQRLLERHGMRVATARDGLDALIILQEHVPDILLLDIEMPRMDGYELATHVRADARLRLVPMVMITSRSGDKHRARAIEIGVDDYLGKPYQESQLLDAIEPLLRRNAHANDA